MPPPRFYQRRDRVVISVPDSEMSVAEARQGRDLAELRMIQANIRAVDASLELFLAKIKRRILRLKRRKRFWKERMDKWTRLHPTQ